MTHSLVNLVQLHPQWGIMIIVLMTIIGTFLATRHGLRVCDVEPGSLPWKWSLVGGGLSCLLAWSMFQGLGQATPEVQPDEFWRLARFPVHAILIALLVSVTATDQRTYWIPDSLVLIGIGTGVSIAWISGETQLIHVWVDWNQEIPQLRGPYLPLWLSQHPHWHGLAWSLAGIACGAGVTWLARWLSSVALGVEALGLGDVTLMAMIGAFLGWQPTLIVFFIAPLCAIGVGIIVRLLGSKTYIPYGPYLSLAAVLVILFWRHIWMLEIPLSIDPRSGDRATHFAIRRLFGDITELSILLGALGGGIVILLGGWRFLRSLPITQNSTPVSPPVSDSPQPESPEAPDTTPADEQ
ncbi:MAG: A24 family peptidase [Planctomycetaceae bacterium]